MTCRLAQCEFSYKGNHYKKKVRELSDTWKQARWMKRLAVGSMVTPEYNGWFWKRVNDNISRPSLENTRPVEEQLQVAPSELEIIKQDFEKKSFKLGKKIEQLEEEKMHLKLDVEVQKSEAEKLWKRKNEVDEDLEGLKTDYKNLRLWMRTARLGKTSEQWRQEIREEKIKADQWEKRFHEAQARNKVLEKSLSESKNEQDELRARVAELERSLCLYQNRNSMMEFRSQMQEQLAKIQQEMKEQMMESQRKIMNQLSQLLVGRMDKGKSPMDNVGENNEGLHYPPGFSPTHV
ncbi:hypothetical protein PVK06_008852 [Gossypium arboreum]|uniref:Uncharacterized protein n=1 Tax=Gossypium arboreum TaxID=29729 RepID=A0ABR0QLT0_GOSAR|nr:hypothetical protein PVK06_008852 [Gossypium arboreum]